MLPNAVVCKKANQKVLSSSIPGVLTLHWYQVMDRHPALPKIVAMKLFLRPIFCAFSALRSIGLFSLGIAGSGGVSRSRSLDGGVGEPCSLCVGRVFLAPRNDFMLCLRLLFAVLLDKLLWRLELFSVFSFSSSSISPVIVLLSVARLSSDMAKNLITPRFGLTPRPSSIAFASKFALRLFVTGWSCELRAVMVSVYAGSKLPPKSIQQECATVTTIEFSGLWYRVERLYDKSVIKVYSSEIYVLLAEARRMGGWRAHNDIGSHICQNRGLLEDSFTS